MRAAIPLAICFLCRVLLAQAVPLQIAGTPNLFAEAVGDSGVATVVIHGGPGVAHTYLRPEWDAMAATGRVVYYDQRGCGRSSLELPIGWRQDLQDLDRVVRAADPAGHRVVLAASSWGTRLALLYAHFHPSRVRGLILSGLPPWPRGAKYVRNGYSATENAHVDSLEAGIPVRATPSVDSATAQAQNPILGPVLAGRLARGGTCPDIARAENDSWFDLPAIESLVVAAPILVLRGTHAIPYELQDRVPADGWIQLMAVMPNAQVAEFADATHDPWFASSNEFFAKALSFVRSLTEH
jgi:pimeloyl-ACP methyl ester carboxylesterase